MPLGMIGERLVRLLPLVPRLAQSIGSHAATLGPGNGGVNFRGALLSRLPEYCLARAREPLHS